MYTPSMMNLSQNIAFEEQKLVELKKETKNINSDK